MRKLHKNSSNRFIGTLHQLEVMIKIDYIKGLKQWCVVVRQETDPKQLYGLQSTTYNYLFKTKKDTIQLLRNLSGKRAK